MSGLKNTSQDWDLVIEPKASLFDLNLRDVWRYRDLMLLFVRRDFVAQYKQTVLGPIWHVVQPLLTTAMFLLVFGKIANIPTDGVPPVLFYMSGITFWNYFSACLTSTSNTFVANANIFGKVYFPRLVLPLSVVLSNLVRLGIQLSLLMVLIIYFIGSGQFNWQPTWSLLLLPVLVMLLAGIGLGLGIIISSLTTKYRDFTVLIGFAVQLLMYGTPVAYSLSYIRGKSFAPFIEWNPLSAVIEGFRHALYNTPGFTPSMLIYPTTFMVVILLVGTVLFTKVERSFMDTV
jgi:lipopolysaccharide transport system permease protein